MEWYYVLILCWFIAVITHAFTRATCVSDSSLQKHIFTSMPMYIERSSVNIVTFKNEYIIDEQKKKYYDTDSGKDYFIKKSIYRLTENIPLELFEFSEREIECITGTNVVYTTKLKIVPPINKT